MRRIGLATARMALAASLFLVPAALPAQEEPELIPEEKAPVPAAPALDTTPPATASGPLRPALDFERWRQMTSRERQTFVEGAVQTMTAMTLQLRSDLEVSGRVPPENLASVVRFIYDSYPKFPPATYLREMESVYMRSEGQTLTMEECFRQAFRRINAR